MITKERLTAIKDGATETKAWAEAALNGDRDGFDGADGEREAVGQAETILDLVSDLEALTTATTRMNNRLLSHDGMIAVTDIPDEVYKPFIVALGEGT